MERNLRSLMIKLAAILVLAGCLFPAFLIFDKPALASDDNTDNWVQLPNVTQGGVRVTADFKHFSVTPDGTAYYSYLIGNKVYLRKLVGNSWIYLGSSSGFTITNIDSLNFFSVAPNGTPYITVAGKVFGSTSRIESLVKFDKSQSKWVCVIKNLNYRVDDLKISSDSRPYVLTNIGIQFIDKASSAQTLPIGTVDDNLYIRSFTLSPDDIPYVVIEKRIDMNANFQIYKFVSANGKYSKVKACSDCAIPSADDFTVNLQISKSNVFYLAAGTSDISCCGIYKLNGSSWSKYMTLPGYAPFFRIGSDSRFYVIGRDFDGPAAYKSYGTNWLEGNSGADYSGNGMFLTSSNVIYAEGESGFSYLYKYEFIPKVPSVNNLKFATDQYGDTPTNSISLGKPIYIFGDLSTNEFSKVTAYVYNSSNQIITTMSLNDQLSGQVSFLWDGKAAAGNTAGLAVGSYVPATSTGINYTVKLYAENSAGGKYSNPQTLKIIGKIPELTSQSCYNTLTLRPAAQTIAVYTANSDLPLTTVTTIRNESKQIVAEITTLSYSQNPTFIEWDGRATAGNKASLKPGDLVPASETGVTYTLQFRVSNVVGYVDSSTYSLIVIKHLPQIGALTLSPDDGDFILETSNFSVNAPVYTVCAATVKLLVYDNNDKLVASVPYTVSSDVTQSYAWDGKATAGNQAGLIAGSYVPASSTGVGYTVKLSIKNNYGSQTSSGYPIIVVCDSPTLSGMALSPSGFFRINGSNKLNVTGTVSSAVTAYISATVYDSNGKVIAELSKVWQPGDSEIISWDGRTTTGNTAGLPAGSIVPAGNYSIITTVVNCAGSDSTNRMPFKVSSSDAYLTKLSIMNGSINYSLNPALNKTVTSYTVSVPYNIAKVEVVAVQEDRNASVAYNSSINLNYGANACTITVTAQDGTIRLYQLKVMRANPPKPTLSTLTLQPAVAYGFTPGGTNLLEVKTTVTTAAPTIVELQVYNAYGKLVARISQTNQATGVKILAWNGKATAGNTAGITAGKAVPVSTAGTMYTIKVFASNPGGSVYSAAATIKLFGNPTVSSFSIYPKTFTANAAGTTSTRIGFKVTHMTNVSVKILNSSGKVVAVLSIKNLSPNAIKYVYWNGKATAGNTAGLTADSLVASGTYSVQILAGNTVYKANVKIAVKR